jgi:sterol 14-demethylase
MATCKELSEDREAIARLTKSYMEIEKSGTPATVLLPWFPSFAKRAKRKATMVLYDTFLEFVELRRKSSIPSNDPIDLFISQGLSNDAIISVRPS